MISFSEIIGYFRFNSKSENLDIYREFQSEMKRYIYNIYIFRFTPCRSQRKKVVGLQLPATHFSLSVTKIFFTKIKSKIMEGAFMLDHVWRYQRKQLEVGRKLPPSYHTMPGYDFDIEKSEVAKWLINQPEILNFVVELIKKSETIVYDKETKRWQGVDYKEDVE